MKQTYSDENSAEEEEVGYATNVEKIKTVFIEADTGPGELSHQLSTRYRKCNYCQV